MSPSETAAGGFRHHSSTILLVHVLLLFLGGSHYLLHAFKQRMLIMAMEQAEIKVSYTGTSKTTDITNAFDSLYIGVKLFRSRTSLLVTPGGH